ncbi:MAG TPA: sigma-70 family RNA polymerase sigma factor [Stellaceae bacterium]|nr:sigma-70 family RNA polymerase sigma factor [Stellaceae bacterium]
MNAVLIEAPFSASSRRPPAARRTGEVASFLAQAADPARQQSFLAAVAEHHEMTAFLALFNHFAPRLKAYMRKLGTSDCLAEELAQDVMHVVWRKAESYDPAKSAVSSWIFTIARNLRIDALRREQRRQLDPNEPLLTPDPLPLPDARLQQEQQSQRVRKALATLPREQAAVVSLAFYQGKSHGEIAADLSIPLGTVKSRMRLAFQRIRDALEEAGESVAPQRARAA